MSANRVFPRSAALVNPGVDLWRAHTLLVVMNPAVVGNAGLSAADGEAQDRGSAGGDGGKSELSHFGSLVVVCIWLWVGRFGGSRCRPDFFNAVRTRLLDVPHDRIGAPMVSLQTLTANRAGTMRQS
jgi:hypothetical protein